MALELTLGKSDSSFADDGIKPIGQIVDERIGARNLNGAVDFVLGDIGIDEGEIFLDCARKQKIALRHIRKQMPCAVIGRDCTVGCIEVDFAVLNLKHSEQKF